jgi:hypothetical protein
MKPIRIVLILFTLVAVPAAVACDDDCPDLARPAVNVTLQGIEDTSLLRVSVATTDGTVLTDAELDQLSGLDAGSYDMVFTHDGSEFGSLSGVCTVGALTGCDAEDAPASDTPSIEITMEGTDIDVSLASNGACP